MREEKSLDNIYNADHSFRTVEFGNFLCLKLDFAFFDRVNRVISADADAKTGDIFSPALPDYDIARLRCLAAGKLHTKAFRSGFTGIFRRTFLLCMRHSK